MECNEPIGTNGFSLNLRANFSVHVSSAAIAAGGVYSGWIFSRSVKVVPLKHLLDYVNIPELILIDQSPEDFETYYNMTLGAPRKQACTRRLFKEEKKRH